MVSLQSKYLTNHQFIVVVIILVIGIFSICTITKDHNWGDDFALYIMHARNIVEAKPYNDTGLIIHDYSGTYSPQNYPPGFPLLLAPVYAIFGLDFIAMKVYMVLWFVLFLVLIWMYFRNKIAFHWNVLLLLIIGLSPFFRDLKESVLSDIPAAVFIMLALVVDEKRREYASQQKYVYLLAFIIWFGAAIRITNILILPAILIFDYFQHRQFKKLPWKMVFIVAGLMIIQMLVMPANDYRYILSSSFFQSNLNATIDAILGRANNYMSSFSGITHIDYITHVNNNLNELLALFFQVTAIAGFYLKARDKFSPAELFTIMYLLLIFIFPGYQGARYMVPVIPFYFFYSLYCLQSIRFKWVSVSATSIMLLTLTIMYSSNHIRMPRHIVDEGVQSASANAAFQFINACPEKDPIFMCAKPRAFSLFTGKSGMVYPDKNSTEHFYEVLEKYEVKYIIRGKYDPPYYVQELNENTSGKFQQLFQNDLFTIYKVN